jgi:hypothetical protein
VFRLEPRETPEIVELVRAPLGILVSEAPEPLKVVADRVPLAELNVRFVPVLGESIPEAPVVNTTLQEVSVDSSSTVMNVDACARVALLLMLQWKN